jgi:predicted deacylase
MDWIVRHEVEPGVRVEALDVEGLATGRLHRLALTITEDALAVPVALPVVVARGAEDGPVVGITAAIHGNELNGVEALHRLLRRIDLERLHGTVVAALVLNVPGYLGFHREYRDGVDLNRRFPGREDGSESELYAHRLVERLLRRFDALIDLHTASFGRANSFYVRANMRRHVAARLARHARAQIIVHNDPGDATWRGQASALHIPAITLEIGDPQVFDRPLVNQSRLALEELLAVLGVLEPGDLAPAEPAVECVRSRWLYTDTGGLLAVLSQVAQRVSAGEIIARLTDPWGQLLRTYHAPEDGIVIGKSTNPVAHAGARVLHLGVIGEVAQGE